ncbi:hypothetical protein WGT02_25685 (plasmid) [Rhizobium sp. T1470]|uniref:hypothetical protein n=1 Tax=unclassified Rhizobium TaxID=2613769 RepID=UPI001AAE8279|nr:hypothetical protein [Rhizobium sp. T1473]MCA0805649.1 hypothetical protein [Rhizobium sp. T1473]
MLKDKITKPASFGRNRSANENRPIASPSAEELIVQASDARATLRSGHGDIPEDVAAEGKLPTEELPTMKELELARDVHNRKVALKDADRR